MVRAVALMSSGLDSLLSAKIIKDQGIDVHGLHCVFSFNFSHGIDHRTVLEEMLRPLGISLRVMDITVPYMNILRNPEHGFGSAVNPCIDCHLFMLRQAKQWMEEMGAQFIVTGEVVGQRPMSQNKSTLFHIEKLAVLNRFILRPLSAQVLPITIPEEEGWVDREKLFGISGRGRKVQEKLAAQLGIKQYFQPAGGCILTDPLYAKRVKTFIQNRGQQNLTSEIMTLCRFGRHFWIDRRLWVIVGRNEKDNRDLELYENDRWKFFPEDEKGPVSLADGVLDDIDILIASRITAWYKKNSVPIVGSYLGEKRKLIVEPVSDEFLKEHRL